MPTPIPVPLLKLSFIEEDSHVPFSSYARRKRSTIYGNRLYARHAMDLRARLLPGNSVGDRHPGALSEVHGRTVDLSRGGAGLTLTREVASGSEVVLCLQVPGKSHPLSLPAVIVRSRGFRVGVKFLDAPAEQRLQLYELCSA
jgi:hypothetical protein